MSFKNRLTLFFMVIVIFPIAVTALLLARTSGQLENTRADSVLNQSLETTKNLYEIENRDLVRQSEMLSQNQEFRTIWSSKNNRQLKRYAKRLIAQNNNDQDSFPNPNITSIQAYGPYDNLVWSLGEKEGLGGIRLQMPENNRISYLELSAISPQRFLRRLAAITGHEYLLRDLSDNHILASTLPLIDASGISTAKDQPLEILENEDYDTKALNLSSTDHQNGLEIISIIPKENSGIFNNQPVLVGVIALLFILAIVMAAILQKNMRDQVASMVKAAKEIGNGNFDVVIETKGNDEMSALAFEINRMSARIFEQIHTVKEQSHQLESSIQLFGETMGSTLDKPKLLRITLEGALELCGSEVGTINEFENEKHQKITINQTSSGNKLPPFLKKPFVESEQKAIRSGKIHTEKVQGYQVISVSVLSPESAEVLASITLARKHTPYLEAEEDILLYIAQSAALSLDNIRLHEKLLVASITDDLTGLANKSRFQKILDKEVSRAKRFDHDLGLIMADIDDFKKINDTYGHLFGDEVLEEVSKQISYSAREVDEPARWGGEEFAILLPEASEEQALEVAERIRKAVEEIEFEQMDKKITLSLGIATLNDKTPSAESLVKSSDKALYKAKRLGKNQSVVFSDTD